MRRGFSGVVGIVMSRVGDFLELGRPFTLVAPALGFFSGGLTAIGAAPYAPWSPCLLIYPLIGSAMAAVLNAGNNALSQIYDLEVDRINKPTRPLPTGRVSIAGVWTFKAITYVTALILAWFVAPAGRHECVWIVLAAVICTMVFTSAI
jgi:geranylgeranylglycerol-phosphate geranylgeranyltransferase